MGNLVRPRVDGLFMARGHKCMKFYLVNVFFIPDLAFDSSVLHTLYECTLQRIRPAGI